MPDGDRHDDALGAAPQRSTASAPGRDSADSASPLSLNRHHQDAPQPSAAGDRREDADRAEPSDGLDLPADDRPRVQLADADAARRWLIKRVAERARQILEEDEGDDEQG